MFESQLRIIHQKNALFVFDFERVNGESHGEQLYGHDLTTVAIATVAKTVAIQLSQNHYF